MKKVQLYINHRGFSLVELLVAVSIFLVFFFAVTDITVNSSKQARHSVNKERAVQLAEEAIEASRNIRDADFTNLNDGTYGLATSSNQFSYSGSSDITGIFTRSIVVSPINDYQKKLDVTVSWADQISDSNSVLLTSYLTDWRKITQTSCINEQSFLNVDTSEVALINNNRYLVGIYIGSTAVNCDIIITHINISYTSPSGRRLQEIFIDGNSVWTGNVNSGVTNDVADFTITPGQSGIETIYRFNNIIINRIFSITFTMSDGTTKTISDISP